jgi:transcriptional regulator with XRE-family HTH domain
VRPILVRGLRSGRWSTLAKVSAQGANRETRVAYWRKKRGISQSEPARATGLTRSTYWRLEQGKYKNPKLRYLVNLALALRPDNGLDDLIEEEWREWLVLDAGAAAKPPNPNELWREPGDVQR